MNTRLARKCYAITLMCADKVIHGDGTVDIFLLDGPVTLSFEELIEMFTELEGGFMNYELYDHQRKALVNMHNGCILNGGVGSGKSRTSLAYYDQKIGLDTYLYIITTAKKRDSLEWDEELLIFGGRAVNCTIDSWNNIQKYKDVTDAFFIFDEDRVTGSGAWVKAFLKIAKNNRFIVLSATPLARTSA